MAWNDGLQGKALAIAGTEDTPLRVMAGPGTGKSFAMKRRVARLLEGGQAAQRVLAVTFTRNAASSLLKDLHALGIEHCEEIRVGTVHAFCFFLLKDQSVFEFLARAPRPVVSIAKSGVLQFEGAAMLDDLVRMGPFGSRRQCTARIRAFEAAWARLQSEEPGWPHDHIDSQFHDALVSWLKFHEAILIGELVPEALKFLKNNPLAPALSAYDHVIVDEYQDLNRAEQDLIDLLAANGKTAIVGDLDQSIYSFRFANPEGIVDFNVTHEHTHDETLDECRRCPKRVVAIADHLIRRNHPGTPGARLKPRAQNPDGLVHIVQWETPAAEAAGLAGYISHLLDAGGYAPGDILILTPRRLLGYSIRDALKQAQVPVHSFYQEEALESHLAQRALSLLTLLANSEDRVALRWWLSSGSPTGRAGPYAALRAHCEETGKSPRSALQDLAAGELLVRGGKRLLDPYFELLESLEGASDLTVEELIDYLFPPADDEVSVLREIALLSAPEVQDATGLYDRIKNHITQPEMPEEGDFVRIMSLHKSKGLTSKVVIVSGCVEGLVPFEIDAPPAQTAASLLEQRRLFYVALTRATDVLLLSSFVHVDRGLAHKMGARVAPGASKIAGTIGSRFLAELGPSAPMPRVGDQFVNANFQ